MNATPPPSGVCPGGTIQYNISYANVVSGGGMGTQGHVSSAYPVSGPGSLQISDYGTPPPSGVASSASASWGTTTGGLLSAVTDTTAGTTCTYNSGGAFVIGAKQFTCTIGGASFQLYPAGVLNATPDQSSGTLTFSVKAQ
jgi:hypothetical protein